MVDSEAKSVTPRVKAKYSSYFHLKGSKRMVSSPFPFSSNLLFGGQTSSHNHETSAFFKEQANEKMDANLQQRILRCIPIKY